MRPMEGMPCPGVTLEGEPDFAVIVAGLEAILEEATLHEPVITLGAESLLTQLNTIREAGLQVISDERAFVDTCWGRLDTDQLELVASALGDYEPSDRDGPNVAVQFECDIDDPGALLMIRYGLMRAHDLADPLIQVQAMTALSEFDKAGIGPAF